MFQIKFLTLDLAGSFSMLLNTCVSSDRDRNTGIWDEVSIYVTGVR